MKLNRRSVITFSVIAAIIATLVFGFFHFYEKVEDRGWKPLTGEAKSDPLFASRVFLKRMGIPTQTLENIHSFNQLPNTNSVILMTASRYSLSDEKIDSLLAWVEQGGHLVIPSTEYWEESYYDIEGELVEENDDGARTSADPLQNAIKVHIDDREHIEFKEGTAREIQLPNASRPLKIASYHYHAIILDDDNESLQLGTVQLDGKNLIIQQAIGAGLITLASNLDFIKYRELDEHDHAEILWHLVQRDTKDLSSPSEVWLIHSDDSPSLLSIIWQRFWPLITMLTVLLCAWGLRASRRFGPLIAKQGEDRRHLMEHIQASGAYYWRHKQSEALLNSTRTAANQRLSRRIPGWHSLTKEQQAEAVANRLSLNTQQVFQTLHGNINHSPYDFAETIKQLEYIRTNV